MWILLLICAEWAREVMPGRQLFTDGLLNLMRRLRMGMKAWRFAIREAVAPSVPAVRHSFIRISKKLLCGCPWWNRRLFF